MSHQHTAKFMEFLQSSDKMRLEELKQIEQEQFYIQQLKEQRERMEILRLEFVKKDQHIIDLTAQNKELDDDNVKLKSAFQELIQIQEQDQFKLRRMELDMGDLQRELAECRLVVESLRDENRQLNSLQTELQNSLSKYKSIIKSKEEQSSNQIYKLEQENQNLKAEISKLDELLFNLEPMRDENDKLKEEVQTIHQQLRSEKKKIQSEMKHSRLEQNKQVEELKTVIEEQSAQIGKMQKEMRSMKEHIGQVKGKMQNGKEKEKQLLEQNEDLKNELKRLYEREESEQKIKNEIDRVRQDLMSVRNQEGCGGMGIVQNNQEKDNNDQQMLLLIFPITIFAIQSIVDRLQYIDGEIEKASSIQYVNARNRFLNGIKVNNEYSYNSTIHDLHLFQLKQLIYPSTNLLFCKQNNSTLIIINMIGIIVAQYNHNATIISTDFNYHQDQFYIGFIDDLNRVVSLNLTINRYNVQEYPQEDIRLVDSHGYYDVFNISLDFTFQLNSIQYTSLLVNQGRNMKIILLSDSHGCVSYYYQNGTLKNKNAISVHPIKSLVRRHPHVMFVADRQIGFINSISLTIVAPKCEQPSSVILSLYQENVYSQNIFVLLQGGDIVAYQVKQGKHTECSILYKIPAVEQHTDIRLVNSYLIGYGHHLAVYNTSVYKTYYTDDVIHLTSIDDIRLNDTQYYGIRINKQTGVKSTVYEIIQNENQQTTIRQLELNHIPMPIATSFSIFESFRFPMILVAIFIVFIFQFWQKKKKTSTGEDDEITIATRKKIDQLVSEYQKAEKPE